ncbi:WAT1-related protein At3g30340-like [Asparagus officinalis]|uniref:WAT1-related protein At3g30340-like n=1 Tax=Asparagus officinalis TaxID=4686 RepID=UPI00098E0718|nr:WAT1-related protein At3g30340-like [Asparagus officinalis]
MGCWKDWKPIFVMLAVSVAYAMLNTMIKKVIDEGMNRLVIITYRQLAATLFMAPVAYFSERKTRPKLTSEIFVSLFFSAILGASLTQYLFFLGLQYTSATFSCAFLTRKITRAHVLSICDRLEIVNPKSREGIAKVLGTIICFTGAMLLTLYRGILLTNLSDSSQQNESKEQVIHLMTARNRGKWMLGTLALFAGTFSWSSWFLLQAKVSKKYPALYSSTALIFFLSFLQAAALSFSTQRGLSNWVLKGKLEIGTVLFSGLVGSGFGFLAMSWCVAKRGPVFTAAFSPLIQILVAGIDVTILHEQLHLGIVLGSVLVIAGLYFLLWGKSKEVHGVNAVKPSEENEEIQGPIPAV